MAVRIADNLPKRTIDPEIYLQAADEALMIMFQDGDALAFYALLERHTGLIWKIARQYFGMAPDTDDLVQDLTLTLWQNKQAWKPGTARFSTWLYRVVSNKCIDLLRQRKILTHDGVMIDELCSRDLGAETHLSRQQQAAHLQKLLAQLPVSQRLALTLYYYEDTALPQIAQKLKVSDLAARSLLKRGKQKLRILMTDQQHSY